MTSPMIIATSGHVQTWTIDNRDAGNAITGMDFIEAFERAVDDANHDSNARAIVLTGAGTIFSSGGNVKEMADRQGMFGLDPRQQRRAYVNSIQRIPRALERLEVAIIAAVNGPAVGAGCDLAMMCDIRIASDRASFAESFVSIGLIPGDGGTWFLPRAIGYERAALMTLTGERIDAATAKAWNLVSTLVPHDELLTAATDIAERIAANPTDSLRMAKRLLQESRTGALESVLGMAAAMQPLAHLDPEHERRLNRWRSK
ncbi:MAG: enoyl-CoA hydratase-related protein [Rhodococcus sp. (in: high G+C Gram-positive bacteria)]|uniref:enoyl-CoA hydratase-related protein n=1 Tax=Rhodococcus sp. TaxID=1831 RepID=UPI003BAE869C